MKNIAKIILLTSSLILVGCNNNTNTSNSSSTNNYSGDCFLVDLIKDEYQVEECHQGLKEDALSQIKYIHDLIEKDESLRIIECKIEEIEEFIKHHQLSDDHIQQKMNELKKYFKNNSYKG